MAQAQLDPLLSSAATPELQDKLQDLTDIIAMLEDCVISDSYKIPDGVNSAIALTEYGRAFRQKVYSAKSGSIPAKEAALMCLLVLGGDELFIDLENTDVDGLVSSLSAQVAEKKIQFGFAFGRESYDAYAELFDTPKPVLTLDETLKLLKRTPPGVNQYGRFVTGPFGIKQSMSSRNLASGRRLEAYHCAQSSCNQLHPVYLASSQVADINKLRSRFEDELDAYSRNPPNWFELVGRLAGLPKMLHSESVGSVAPLIGDCLTLNELRALVSYVLDNSRGTLREIVSEFREVRAADEFANTLDRADLLQIALLADERDLQHALDALVKQGQIEIAAREVRAPVTNARRRSGAFRLTPELGTFGARFVSADDGLPLLRLKKELLALYHLEDEADRSELGWRIREIEAENLEDQLDTFFRESDPRLCIERLGLARRSGLEMLTSSLGIEQALEARDTEIVSRILWKLGFKEFADDDPRAEFWSAREKFATMARSAQSPGSRDTEEFLGVASKFFRELERYLAEALVFASWSMSHDHYSDSRPFQYGLSEHEQQGRAFLHEAFEASGDKHFSFDFHDERADLTKLTMGFGYLGRHLQRLAKQPDTSLRSETEIPDYDGPQRLKRFPLRHTVPFLDLEPAAQSRIAGTFVEISQALTRGKVADVRNDHQHYRRSTTGSLQIVAALEEVERSLLSLELAGFGGVELRVNHLEQDPWGRTTFHLTGPRGARHTISLPTAFDRLPLPHPAEQQLVVGAAVFAAPGEVLRFRRIVDGRFTELWSNFPNRRLPNGSSSTDTLHG